MQDEEEIISVVRVDMGQGGEMRALDLSAFGLESRSVFLQVGVPHTMLFINEEQIEGSALSGISSAFLTADILSLSFSAELIRLTEKYGSPIEKAPLFAEGSNVNFVLPSGTDRLLVSTWERGAGRTLACGTGACASAAAAYQLGLTGPRVRVRMPGGEVTITIAAGGALQMEGEACLVCKGEFFL